MVHYIYKYSWDDGSVYIGQTFHNSGRYGDASSYRSSKLVYNKIKKYGFQHKEIIRDNLSDEEVNDFEIYYIKLFNSYHGDNPKGLNLTRGGGGTLGYNHIEETKNKISESLMGHPVSEKIKKRMRENNPCKYVQNVKKKVRCIDTGEIFESIEDASKKCNINRSSLGKVCRKERTLAGKLRWEFVDE